MARRDSSVADPAFADLVAPHRSELLTHCYRMLGSLAEAEEATQEALLRAWRGHDGFDGRGSLRGWLYRIATNVCLRAIERRPPATMTLEPIPDELLVAEDGHAAPEARYERRESVELAFIAALRHLPGNQRAALVLRDVLALSAAEAAEVMETTEPAVNSALQRARALIDERLPSESQQSTLRALGDEQLTRLVSTFAEALERGDLDTLVALLAEDATWSMPPGAAFEGREAISGFLTGHGLREQWRHRYMRANGQPALGCYRWDGQRYVAGVIDVLELRGDRVAAVYSFIGASRFARFGLPAELPPSRA